MTRLNETGNYSCVATNEAGIDKREFSVTVVGKMYIDVVAAKRSSGF